MGNSTSKQGSSSTIQGPTAHDSRLSKKKTKSKQEISPHTGIVPHPYQVSNPYNYQSECSSEEEDSQSQVEPMELFRSNRSIKSASSSIINSISHVPNYYRNFNTQKGHSQGRSSMQSMGSLAYSESAASVVTSKALAAKSLASDSNSNKTSTSNSTIRAKNTNSRLSSASKGSDSTTSSKTSKGSMKLGMFRKKKQEEKKDVPYEETLSYAIAKHYGERPQSQSMSQQSQSQSHSQSLQAHYANGKAHGNAHGRPLPLRHHMRNVSSTMHDVSVFADGSLDLGRKLPTIADESYQSSTAGYDADDNVQNTNMSNILGELEEDYEEEEREEEQRGDEGSMVSKEYTVKTEEMADLPYAYSASKNIESLGINIDINSMLDRQHASYVEGQDPKDITMPIQNLGNFFANVTMNDTMNDSKYQSFDESRMSHVFQDTTLDRTDFEEKTEMHESKFQDDTNVFEESAFSAEDANEAKDYESEDAFDHFVQHRTDSFALKADEESDQDENENEESDQDENEETAEDDVESIDDDDDDDLSIESSVENSIFASEASVENSIFASVVSVENSIFASEADEESVQESSVEDSTVERSLLTGSVADLSNALNQSSADQCECENSSFQNDDGDVSDEMNESSVNGEDILDCTEVYLADQTDMAIVPQTIEEDDTTMKTAQIVPKPKKGERKRSPMPEIGVKAPITSALTNILPAMSQNEDDEDDEDEDLYFDEVNNEKFQEAKGDEDIDIHTKEPVVAIIPANERLQQQKRRQEIEYKGPEIGTFIRCVRNAPKVQKGEHEDIPGTNIAAKPSADTVENRRPSNAAYSRQVAKNSIFLFSEDGVRRETPLAPSMVDEQRLALVNKENIFAICGNDSIEAIKEKLDRQKSESNKEIIARKTRSSLSISKIDSGFQVDEKGIQRIPVPQKSAEPVEALAAQLDKSLKIGSSKKSPNIGGFKRSSDNIVEIDSGNCGSKRNRLDAHLSATQSSSDTDREAKSQSDVVSSGSFGSDDISLTELQIRQSAITPMKNPKSPYVRFKKSLRLFEKKSAEAEPPVSNEPRKTPPRKNAAAGKGFLFAKGVTSIDGRLRQNRQVSAKKARRLTSGLESIAPRKPTLADPLFKRQTNGTINAIVEDIVENVDEECSLVPAEENDDAQPYDEADESDLFSYSNGSSMLSDFDSMLDVASVGSPDPSVESTTVEEHPLGLRSAMKKKGDKNTSIRVSFIAPVLEKNSRQKLSRNLDSSFALSPSDNDSRSSQTPPRPDRSAAKSSTMRTSFKVYSPARESLASQTSPRRFVNVNAPVNPAMMAMKKISPSETSAAGHSEASFSPVLSNFESSVIPAKRAGIVNHSELNLSPGPGRRTPSQNRKWTGTSHTPTKNWREVQAEQKEKKKQKKSDKKKRRSSGPLKLLNY